MSHAAVQDPFVLITRLIDAPRELVFRSWSEAKHLEKWYAPNGCGIEFRKLEFRPGGNFHSCIRTPDGHQCWCTGVYEEIADPERIVYSMFVSDESGKLMEPTSVGMDPEWPAKTIVTVKFEAVGNQTRLTLHQTVGESLAKKTGAYPSWLSMLDRLESELSVAGNAEKLTPASVSG